MPTSETINKELERKRILYQRAQDGDLELLSAMKKEWGLKVYTNEEVAILNTYLKRKAMGDENQNEIFMMRDKEKILMLPSLNGHEYQAIINWIQQEDDDFYIAGLTYIGGDRDGGSTEWMLKKDVEVGFIPLFCTLHWEGR